MLLGGAAGPFNDLMPMVVQLNEIGVERTGGTTSRPHSRIYEKQGPLVYDRHGTPSPRFM
ncbi:hypothetical protein GCM10027601_20380 [Nocardioides ungokensis]